MSVFDKLLGGLAKAVVTRAVKAGINPEIFQYFYNKSFPDIGKLDYSEAYNSWAFTCINQIAGDVSMIELIMQERNKDGEWETIPDEDPIRLLRRPNPVMTGADLFNSSTAWKLVDGNTFWYIAYDLRGKPMEIWPIESTRTYILKDPVKIVSGYEYLNWVGRLVSLDTSEVIHFKTFNPKDPYRGRGVVQAASTSINTDLESGKWNLNFFKNSAQPDSVLQTDKKLSTEVYSRLKKTWNAEYQGVNNAHKTAILEEGLTLKPTSLTHRDMDFLALRNYTRDEICALFRVPKLVLGFIEGTNRASADTIEYVYTKKNIYEEMLFFVHKLNAFYLPLWNYDPEKKRIWFKNPVPDDDELLLKKLESGIDHGYRTINETRSMINEPPIKGGDVLRVSSLLAPIDDPANNDDASGKDEPVEDNENNNDGKKTIKKTQTKTGKFKTDKMASIKSETIDIYSQMKNHVMERLGAKKKSAKGLLYRLKAEVNNENPDEYDAPDIPPDKNLEDHVLADWSVVWTPVVASMINKYAPVIYTEGGTQVLLRAGSDAAFDTTNQRAVEWLKQHALEQSKEIPATVEGEIRRRIVDGVANGDSIKNIAGDIGDFFDTQSDWRALRVARTEVMTAYRGGTLEGKLQLGDTTKTWIVNSGDPCPLCLENQGEGSIPITQDFINGDDPHPNCTCDIG